MAPGTIAFGVYEGEGSYAPDMVASDMRPVDGLGDRAAISPGTGIVQWVQGERTYQLQFALAGDASEAAMETLARQASARIG